MQELAGTYIHFPLIYFEEEEFNRVCDKFEMIADDAARITFETGVILEVRFEEGSWKVWLTVLGLSGGLITGTVYVANNIYDGITDYHKFQKSVEESCKKSDEFSKAICDTFIPYVGSGKTKVIIRKPKKVPQKLKEIMDEIDLVGRRYPRFKSVDTEQHSHEIQRKLIKLHREVKDEEFMGFVLSNLKRLKVLTIPEHVEDLERFAPPKKELPILERADYSAPRVEYSQRLI